MWVLCLRVTGIMVHPEGERGDSSKNIYDVSLVSETTPPATSHSKCLRCEHYLCFQEISTNFFFVRLLRPGVGC